MIDNLVVSFCKVEAVCYQGELNWLGWLIAGVAWSLIFACFVHMFTQD
jgi:hypothetical protein